MDRRSVLVAFKNFQIDKSVLKEATRIARSNNAVVYLLNIVERSGFLGVYNPSAEEELFKKAESEIAKAKDYLRSEGVEAVGLVRFGERSEIICEVAKKIKPVRIVIGNRGLKGIKRLLFGGVPERVVKASCCPVYVVE
ncbi:universal stress protein [Thermodesulfobium sp.]|jgi:nucleotide-binding universal stress UspA family protein|uniref:Universal stress protein n=1 Tax=Thermodesulfobium narugense TaxID=184064 RepID=A0A7C5PQX7_9BACT